MPYSASSSKIISMASRNRPGGFEPRQAQIEAALKPFG
jgi:hypothetical protein